MKNKITALLFLTGFALMPAGAHAADPAMNGQAPDPAMSDDNMSRRHGQPPLDTDDPDNGSMSDSENGGLTHDMVPPPPPPTYHDLSAGGPANSAAGPPPGAPPPGSVNQIPDVGGQQPGNWKSGPHPPALGPKTGGAAQVEQHQPPPSDK